MTPFFIISTPRSKATLLMRMLDASPGIRCAGESTPFLLRLRGLCDLPAAIEKEHGAESWPMHRQHVEREPWQSAVAGMLKSWVNPPEGATHYGIRSSFLGRHGWTAAVDAWSWILQTWPGAKIIFLTRDQAEVELSMLGSSHLWRPAYGNCPGVCGQRVHDHLQSMHDFAVINPQITTLLDAADLSDFTKTAAALAKVGIPLAEGAWSRELEIMSGSREQLKAERKDRDRQEQEKREAEHPFFRTDLTFEQALALAPGHAGTAPPSRVAVYTLRYGSPDWLKPCAKTLEAWTKRHGYNLHVRGPNGVVPDEKFATLDMLSEFLAGSAERFVFIDADVMIHEQAPAWPESDGFQARPDPGDKTVADWREWLTQESDAEALPGWQYCNSGVWSCDREAAAAFLAVADGERRLGYREQHQFNAWLHRATAGGMKFAPLPAEWNALPSVEPERPGWMIHFAGKKKGGMIRRAMQAKLTTAPVTDEDRLAAFMADPFGDKAETAAIASWKPAAPWPFIREEPLHDRAIILPWLSKAVAWGEEELRHALRSIHENFTDKACPIIILGDRKPSFRVEGGRVQFVAIDYSKGREHGLRLAYAKGLQIADEVLLWMDDFYLLRPTSWDDFSMALHRGDLSTRAEAFLASDDGWLRTLGTVCRDLQAAGIAKPKDFATHTPFRYERRKAIETLERFHLRYRGSFETLYYNHHDTPSRRITTEKAKALPAPPGARFLNHSDKTLTPELRRGISCLFPLPAPWEAGIPRLIHQTWKDRRIPHNVYPAAWPESWKRLHPEWEYKLWTDADLVRLAREHYPEFVPLLRKARGVIRGDIGRLLVLHRHGGLYVDLDYLCLKPLDGILAGTSLALPGWKDGAVTNALMAGLPGHQFFLDVATEGLRRWQNRPTSRPEEIAGPEACVDALRGYVATKLDPALVCPFDWREHRPRPAPEEYPEALAFTDWRHGW